MRRGYVIFLVVNLLIIAFLVRSVWTLLSLLVETAQDDAIHRSDLPAPNSPLIDTRPQLIPKIIHQTYKNETIPLHWRPAQKSCIDLHEDYEYIVRLPSELRGLEMGLTWSSFGPMRNRENLSPPNTRGSWTRLTATVSPSNAQMPLGTLC